MQNEAGENVDMYIPRKCSVTNCVIAAKDHASVQLNIGEIDDTGRFTGNFKTYALSGNLRQMVMGGHKVIVSAERSTGEADNSLTMICIRDSIINKNYDS